MALRDRRSPTRSRPVAAGQLLSKTFTVWARNLLPFSVLTLLLYLPLVAYSWVVWSEPVDYSGAVRAWQIVLPIGAFLSGLLASGAVTYGVVRQLQGTPAGLGRSVVIGLSRFGPTLVTGILMMLLAVLALIPMFVMARLGPGSMLLGGIIGLALLAVLLTIFYVALPTAVVERRMGTAALGRSADLTKGSRWGVFGAGFTVVALQKGLEFVLRKTMLAPDSGVGDVHRFLMASLVLAILMSSLQAVSAAVAYHDLRVAKEGVSSEELARVFE